MRRRKNSQTKRLRGETILLTVPQDLKDWLAEHTKKRGASSIQETVRQILTAAKVSEQEKQAA